MGNLFPLATRIVLVFLLVCKKNNPLFYCFIEEI